MRYLKYVILLALVVGLVVGYMAYSYIYVPNVPAKLKHKTLLISEGSSYDQVVNELLDKGFIENESSFRTVAQLMKYDQKSNYAGRYEITPGWNNRELISHIRSGNQAPVKVTISQVRTIDEMCGKAARYLAVDSLSLLQYVTDPSNLKEWGYTADNIITMFIPNSYEFYWNTSPEKFVDRMKKEHSKYWSTPKRKAQLAKLNKTPAELYTLASIVEKETTNAKELNTVSGVYHNRLQRGIALQADPTVVFAVGDFTIRRVLNKHLRHESPFNTYIHAGLPPGPICMPSLASLDAAINPEKHGYIYFCAKPGYKNEHAFAKTLREHNRNASIFHSWLNKEGIKK